MGGIKDDSGDAALARSFGASVTSHREKAKISMASLANSSGMSRAAMWRIEHGEVLPSLRTIARIAIALNLPVWQLLQDLDTTQITLANRNYHRARKDASDT
jgi:transcriptional regulator with XRE-family HTH domain